ncbi:hypothetical protein [Planomicrobium sp. Y74]|uniref:hypothetical protein n=1 Tax=Planomicrobium sp. Y74 TaxID=2478977 RepID=UPI0011C37B2D|nr:hypothetical protein [Planomicrobium sp. Y74]
MDLAQKLSHVYWIGGSPCAGKSTIARMLTEEFGFRYYKSDDTYDEHLKRSSRNQHPNLSKLKGLSWGEYWSPRFCTVDVEQQIQESLLFYEEQFSMVLEDLLGLPDSSPILVEGSVVLPSQVAPLLSQANQAVWLFPTPEFQIHHYSRRPWIDGILGQTEEPEKAFRHWMEKEMGFAEKVHERTQLHDFKSLRIDDSSSIDHNYQIVRNHFDVK